MRCWKTPTGNHLVEAPDIPRLTWRDPTPNSEARLLLREVKAWLAQNARGDRVSNLERYYEVDEQGIVRRSYEEYSFSYEDDQYSWGYCVIGDQLWEFTITHDDDDCTLKARAAVENLELAELPEGTKVTTPGR